MPFPSNLDAHLPLPRRNARSFDLDDSAAKAAAWVWHLHSSNPGVTTEGRFLSSQSRRRSSSSYDRKASRFQQEAVTPTNSVSCEHKTEMPMWDCGSNLYDTFELVAFGNRLDRSLMEVVPTITPSQAHPQEHHMKSPLRKPGGVLRTLSLPRSLSWQSKNRASISSRNAGKFKLSSSYNNGTRESTTGSGEKASTKWSVGKFMNVIKKMLDLHKQVGCKRSTNVIECSQRPLDLISKTKDTRDNQFLTKFSTRNSRGSECMDNELPIQYTKIRCNSDSMSSYKLSIPSMDKPDYDKPSMQEKIRAHNSERLGDGLSLNKKIRSHSESMSDGLLDHKKIKSRRRDGLAFMDNRVKGSSLDGFNVKERIKCSKLGGVNAKERIRGSNLGGVNATERIKGANDHLDLHKHLHHHHHYHHHHHLHHNLASESARLSPETMSHICAEQSWLI